MSDEFKVYVIYKDGKPYIKTGIKTVYLKIGSARSVITTESQYDAIKLYDSYCKDNNINGDWYDSLSKYERNKWLEMAKSHYEVKVFTEDKGQSLNYNYKVYFVIMKNVNKFGITSDYDNIENTANEIAYNQLCIKDLQREMTMIDDEEYFNELNERNKRNFNNERKKYEVKEVIGRKNINKVFKELYDMFGNPVINKLDEKYKPLICGITYI